MYFKVQIATGVKIYIKTPLNKCMSCMYTGPSLIINVPADDLAPNGARSSAGTVMKEKLYKGPDDQGVTKNFLSPYTHTRFDKKTQNRPPF